jgi:hypothetical protein
VAKKEAKKERRNGVLKMSEDENTKILREILKWIKFAGMKEVKSTLSSVLDTEQKRLVYHASDGSRGSVEIAKLAGIGSNRTVADMWDAWLKLGLGESIPVRGGVRFKRTFDLVDFGFEVPRMPEAEKSETQAGEPPGAEKAEALPQPQEGPHA